MTIQQIARQSLCSGALSPEHWDLGLHKTKTLDYGNNIKTIPESATLSKR